MKKRFFSLLLAFALSLALTACGGAPAGNTAPSALVYGSADYTRINPAMDEHCEINVLLTDDAGIQAINLAERGVDAPTDVLSFPMFDLRPGDKPSEADADPGSHLVPLGDMVLNLDRVRSQGEEYGHGPRRECAYLAVHSILHLLGYDHMDDGPMKAQMREREEAILAKLGIGR